MSLSPKQAFNSPPGREIYTRIVKLTLRQRWGLQYGLKELELLAETMMGGLKHLRGGYGKI